MDYYGKFIVIQMDFKCLDGANFMGSFSTMISELFAKHREILNKMNQKFKSDPEIKSADHWKLEKDIESFKNYWNKKANMIDLANSLTFLVELISQWHEEEIIITIDEIDYGIMNFIYLNPEILTADTSEVVKNKKKEICKHLEFVHNFISGVCKVEFGKSNKTKIKHVIMTGITDVMFSSSKLNTIKKLDMKSGRFQKHYGVTESELEQVINGIFDPINENHKKTLLSMLKEWYNGYSFPNQDFEIYNVWSIISYFKQYLNHLSDEKVSIFKPESFWIASDRSIILSHLSLIIQNKKALLENLNLLAEKKELSQTFYHERSINLYYFLRNFDERYADQVFPDILMSAGYITSSKDGRFKIPNKEILLEFKNRVIPVYVSHLFKELNLKTDICAEITENLNDDNKFQENVKKILKNVRNDRNEDYFKCLIFAAVEFQNLEAPDKSNYLANTEKYVDESRGKIDDSFIATEINPDKTDIIIECKVLHKTTMSNASDSTNDALWQVFCKNYISEQKNKHNPSWSLKVRPLVFQRDETSGEWFLHMKTFQYDLEKTENIIEFFSKKMSTNLKKILSNPDEPRINEFRSRFLNFYDISSIEEFIQLVSEKKMEQLHGELEEEISLAIQIKKNQEIKKKRGKK